MEKSIMTECYSDTLLIEVLIPPKKGYNHKPNCFAVEKEMKIGKLKDRFAVGIIDNDKNQIKYLEEFEKINEVEEYLILWKHTVKSHYIIQICPALERWIFNLCEKGEIELFQPDFESFLKLSKSQTSSSNQELRNLFKRLSKREDLLPIRKLKNWLVLLKEKNYKAEIKDLQNA